MNKYIVILLVFCLSGIFSKGVFAQDMGKVKKVVIDAGHGGDDPGTMGKNSKEKNIALSIALKVGALIEENFKDVDVIYTRKTDVFIELHKRAEIANKSKADLFISIHCNSVANSSSSKGTETWIMGTSKNAKNMEVAKKENSAILLESNYSKNYDNFDPNSTESYITMSLIQSAYRDQSLALAESVQNQFANKVHRGDRGVKEAGFLVLVYTAMPSILIETGFLSNSEEEAFLLSDKGQDYMASAIYRAFKDYKQSIEGSKYTEKDDKKNITKVDDDSDNIQTEQIPEKTKSTNKIKDKKEVVFGVQFTTQTKKTNFDNNTEVTNVWMYQANGVYKYVSGKYLTFNEATKAMKEIQKGKYKDAFVVAFIDGKRVSRTDAEAAIKASK